MQPPISVAPAQITVILSEAIASFAIAKSKDPDAPCPTKTLRTFLPPILLAIALLFVMALPAHAQGCAQCLDTTRATPPSVQAAYRHAILLLAGFAAAIFIAGGLLLARHRKY